MSRSAFSGESSCDSRTAGTQTGSPPCFSTSRASSRLIRDSRSATRGGRRRECTRSASASPGPPPLAAANSADIGGSETAKRPRHGRETARCSENDGTGRSRPTKLEERPGRLRSSAELTPPRSGAFDGENDGRGAGPSAWCAYCVCARSRGGDGGEDDDESWQRKR